MIRFVSNFKEISEGSLNFLNRYNAVKITERFRHGLVTCFVKEVRLGVLLSSVKVTVY